MLFLQRKTKSQSVTNPGVSLVFDSYLDKDWTHISSFPAGSPWEILGVYPDLLGKDLCGERAWNLWF